MKSAAAVTVRTRNAGNTAIEEHVFTLPLAAARAVAKALDCRSGSYWHTKLAAPMRRAARAKRDHVSVATAGFSTGELASALYSVGYSTRCE